MVDVEASLVVGRSRARGDAESPFSAVSAAIICDAASGERRRGGLAKLRAIILGRSCA
jgi:hypothetical protein